MFYNSIPLIKPRVALPLDGGFCPAILWNHAFLDAVRSSGKELPLAVGLERNDGVSQFLGHKFFPQNISWLLRTYYMLNG